MLRNTIFILLIGVLALATGLVIGQAEKKGKAFEYSISHDIGKLSHDIKRLREELTAYEYRLNDLSIAYINHHGDYPKTVRKEE